MNIPNTIKNIMQVILDNNFEAYIVGGAVRDYFSNIEPHDYDIFTNASGKEILKMFPEGKVLGNDERQEKILTVIVDDVEVSSYRKSGDRTETGNTLKEHINTCDFTVNAIAMDINGKIIDLVNGIYDIRNGLLQFVGNAQDRINEDPLRILRGIRFWSTFGCFRFKDLDCVLKNLHLLDTIPKERLREEFMKILNTDDGLENLWCDEIIYKIMPMLKTIMNIQGGSHHNEMINRHLFLAFMKAKEITNNKLIWLSALLHDIGKGVTLSIEVKNAMIKEASMIKESNAEGMIETGVTVEGENEIHFYEHEKKGAEMVNEWMTEYKFSSDDIKFVTAMVSLHMYSYKSKPSKKSYIKFFIKMEKAGIDIMDYVMLLYCDHQGNQKKKRIKFGDFVKNNWLHAKYWECKYTKEPFAVKDLVVGGKDLIERYGMTPSPEIGKMLNKVYDKIIDGDLRNDRAEIFYFLEYFIS